MYGDVVDIGALNALLIIFQLVFAGVLVLCLDELLEKEYGLGSGISLFIATNICEIVMWKSFSINSYQTITGNYEYEGGIVALFHLLITKEDKVLALQRAFYRNDMGLPNITNLMSTVFILLVVVWYISPFYRCKIRSLICFRCQGIVINIKLKSSKVVHASAHTATSPTILESDSSLLFSGSVRTGGKEAYQAVLHLQHARHLAYRRRQQHILLFSGSYHSIRLTSCHSSTILTFIRFSTSVSPTTESSVSSALGPRCETAPITVAFSC